MTDLIADIFRHDPRVARAKKLILEALYDHQEGLEGISPPHGEKTDFAERVVELRGFPATYPLVGSGFGNGCLVELTDGSVKIDLINGIGVHPGHSVPLVMEAAIDGACEDVIQQGNLQGNREAVELMERLCELSGLDHCLLTTSGAMACENALKIAFQKRAPRDRILAFDHCFTGRSCATVQITDKPDAREGLPETLHVDRIPFCTEESVAVLEKHLKAHPDSHAAMIFELVQGEGGVNVGDREILVAIMEKLKEHGILVIADEVQTFARTHELFAFHHFELQKWVDIVTIGKLAQVCGTLYRSEVKPKPGLLGQTFISSSVAIKTSRLIIEEMIENGSFGPNGRNAKIHQYFAERLQPLAPGPYGVGLMCAFTPFGGDPDRVKAFGKKLFDNGVITFTAGRTPLRTRCLLPPLAITEEVIDQVIPIIEETLHQCS